ncbi:MULTISPECIES: TetR/AcrR family transcriptional regulator [Bacillus]|uniref:TetR/AcrR family transcriptional regulator n=1 Tax=Bacillus TaxID=1386 RepID=UPI000D01A332|nr:MULTISPECIES: TetR/AcrR family transcriptional regulator [Bacillus]MDR0124589.1 TetR/AcrR family transcriptional regulator [Bacillus zhangzhouensis]PRO41021.1 TetR family transcriptional regulator [Bacillus sp. LLTC93]
MINKEDRRVERTKETLRQAFKMLVKEKGYSHVKVKDIVEKANYNRTTFYVHYDSKDELAAELIHREMEDFEYEFCKPTRENPLLDLTRMKPEGTNVFQYIVENRDYYDLLVMKDRVPQIQEILLKKLQYIFQSRMSFVSDQYEEINDSYFIQYRSYGIFGLILEWIRNQYNASPSEMARRIINLLYIQSSLMIQLKDEEMIIKT